MSTSVCLQLGVFVWSPREPTQIQTNHRLTRACAFLCGGVWVVGGVGGLVLYVVWCCVSYAVSWFAYNTPYLLLYVVRGMVLYVVCGMVLYVVWQDDDEAGGPRKRGRRRKDGLMFGSSGGAAFEGEASGRQWHVPSARAQPAPGPRAFQAAHGGSEVLAGYVLCLVFCVLCPLAL